MYMRILYAHEEVLLMSHYTGRASAGIMAVMMIAMYLQTPVYAQDTEEENESDPSEILISEEATVISEEDVEAEPDAETDPADGVDETIDLAEFDLHEPRIELPFHYMDEHGNDQTTNARGFDSVKDEGNVIIEEDWYYVDHDRTFEYRPSVVGNVKLILADGVTLNMTHGIRVQEGIGSIEIYGQSMNHDTAGKLICGAYDSQAALGGNDGSRNGDITIHSGCVEAYGGSEGAGIGGGNNADGGTITILGGFIKATGGEDASGIGGGCEGNGGSITINGGTIEAHGSLAIGSGADVKDHILFGSRMAVAGFPYAQRYDVMRYGCDVLINETDDGLRFDPVEYLDKNSMTYSTDRYTDFGEFIDTEYFIIHEGWYVVKDSESFNNRPSVQGRVNLILCAGVVLDMKHGIHVGDDGTLSIYTQPYNTGEEPGKLICHGEDGQAGIGGNEGEKNGSILIESGAVESYGGSDAAGIGGGNGGDSGIITNYNGEVTAYGGSSLRGAGAGIGGGNKGRGGSISIYGGSTEAFGPAWAAGIGGGYGRTGGYITIYGGDVHAVAETGSINGAGAAIGGGFCGNGGVIEIRGGKVVAEASSGAAIGGGQGASSGDIRITGGVVTATTTGDSWSGVGAAIGSGADGENAFIVITGGKIRAISNFADGVFDDEQGAGIGCGSDGKKAEIEILGGTITAKGHQAIGAGNGTETNQVTVTLSSKMHVYQSAEDPRSVIAQKECTLISK